MQLQKNKTILGFVHNTKTETSTRTIKVLPQIMQELDEYKKEQDKLKHRIGKDYYKYNLVFPR